MMALPTWATPSFPIASPPTLAARHKRQSRCAELLRGKNPGKLIKPKGTKTMTNKYLIIITSIFAILAVHAFMTYVSLYL